MDKYDQAIAYLHEHPEEIEDAWHLGSHPAECLFVPTDGKLFADSQCGCLTQIAGDAYDYFSAPTLELTAEIRADHRIPHDVKDIRLEDLPVFAEWQRRLERERGE